MAQDIGNAVNAQWVGPSGMQLWDGTVLNAGDIVLAVGLDEANDNPYWKPLKALPKGVDPAELVDVSSNRHDPDQDALLAADAATAASVVNTSTATPVAIPPVATSVATQGAGS